MANDVGSVHISTALTNISLRLEIEEMVADQVMKRVKVNKQADKIRVYDKSHLRAESTLIGSQGKGRAREISFGFKANETYFCEGYGLIETVTQKEINNADKPINPKIDATQGLTDIMAIDREIRVATQVLDTNNVTKFTTLLGTSKWSDYINGVSDPITDIKDGILSCRNYGYHTPNSMILDWETAITLVAHPSMVDITSVGTPTSKSAVLKIIKDMFDINPIIAKGMKLTSEEGATDVLSPIWGKDVLIAYINPKPALKSWNFGMTFDWKPGRIVTSWKSQNPRGVKIFVEENGLDSKILIEKCGYLIKAAIA